MATKVPLQSIVLQANSTSVTFANLPQFYTDLVIVANVKRTLNPANTVFTFNGNNAATAAGTSGGLYSTTYVYGDGTSPGTGKNSNNIYGYVDYSTDINNYTLSVSHFNSYSNTTGYKTMINRAGTPNTQTITHLTTWRSTDAINSITYTCSNGQLTAGSTFDVYGIKAGTPKLMGGDAQFTDGNYWYHVFKTTGSVTALANGVTADLLVVAGGGSGGWPYSGGGGAGGLVGLTSQYLSGTYTVTVGAGAAGSYSALGQQGSNSQFGSLTAAVGGGGGTARNIPTGQQNGGSGGGGGYNYTAGGTATAGQGNAGGTGSGTLSATDENGGGGGGAGVAGGNATATLAGAGGNGSSAYSSWGSATGMGQNVGGTYYFAGGGGGGTNRAGGNQGAGGYGGGGSGAANGTGPVESAAGTANTGGGSGGGGAGNTPGSPKNGGSGIVIVRYAV